MIKETNYGKRMPEAKQMADLEVLDSDQGDDAFFYPKNAASL